MLFDWAKIQILQDAFPVLLNNEFLADIKFNFPTGQFFYAHSFILSLRSEEFYENYKGTYGTPKTVVFDDVSHGSFYEFLKYLYSDQIDLNMNSIFDLMKLSIKYKITSLHQKCSEFMFTTINDDTVCLFLEMAITQNWVDLKYLCQEFISKNFMKTLQSKTFLKINDETLKTIMKLDSVSNANEYQKFVSIVEWTSKLCDSKLMNGKTLRQKLGTNIDLINFNAMTTEEFAKCLQIAPGFLNDNEIGSIFKTIATRVTIKIPLDHQTKHIKQEIMDSIDDSDQNDNFSISQIPNWEDIPAIKLHQTFFFEFAVTQIVSIESVAFLIYGKQTVQYSLVENDKEIFTGKGEIIKRKLKMTPIQLEPMRRYRFEYRIICKHFEKIRANLYASNLVENILSDKKSVELTVYRRYSHIHWFNFSY